MRTFILLSLLGTLVGCSTAERATGVDRRPDPELEALRRRNTLSAETKKILDTGQRFFLLSLDPMRVELRKKLAEEVQNDPGLLRSYGRRLRPVPPPELVFHGYEVLGKTEIRDQRLRTELLRLLYQSTADADVGVVAACFAPRHGIRATLGDETIDLLICFECVRMIAYGNGSEEVQITSTPAPAFNRVLKRARIPIAKEE